MGTIKKDVPFTLGLIHFKATIVSAVSSDAGDSHLYCTGGDTGVEHPPARIRQPYRCGTEDCAATSGWVKGVEHDGAVKILTDEDKAALSMPHLTGRVDLRVFPREQVMATTLPGKTAYYLTPDLAGITQYRLMVELVRTSPDRAIITVFKPKSNHNPMIWLLGVSGSALNIQTLYWPQDVLAGPAVPDLPLEAKLITLGQRALKAQAERRFDPAEFLDPLRRTREELLTERTGVQIVEDAVAEAPLDLTEALRRMTESKRRKSTAA